MALTGAVVVVQKTCICRRAAADAVSVLLMVTTRNAGWS